MSKAFKLLVRNIISGILADGLCEVTIDTVSFGVTIDPKRDPSVTYTEQRVGNIRYREFQFDGATLWTEYDFDLKGKKEAGKIYMEYTEALKRHVPMSEVANGNAFGKNFKALRAESVLKGIPQASASAVA